MTRMTLSALAALVCYLVLPETLRAQTAKQVVEKGIEAHGGEANLKKYTSAVVTTKGTLSILGMQVEMEGVTTYQLPDRLRNVLTMKVMGKTTTIVQIYNAGKSKMTMDGRAVPLEAAQKDELKATLALQVISDLYPLLDGKKFELSLLDKAENVGGKEVIGILVKSKEIKDTRLFFDKKTYVVVKVERKGLSLEGKEADEEHIFLEHKKVDGVLCPTKGEMLMDGKKLMTIDSVTYKYLDKVDPKEFDLSD